MNMNMNMKGFKGNNLYILLLFVIVMFVSMGLIINSVVTSAPSIC